MRRHRPNIFHFKTERARDVSYGTKAFKDAVEKFNKVHRGIEPVLKSLFRDSQRAKGARERLQDGRAVLINALRILQENDDADARVEAAMNELSEAQADHAHYDNRHSNDLVLFALKAMKNEERYQSKRRSELDKVIKEFRRVRDNFREVVKDNFGTQLIPTTAETQADKILMTLFKDACHILKIRSKNKSIAYLMKAICIWQEAYEAQADIDSVYKDKKVSRLKFEADNLRIDVRSEELRDQPNVYKIRFWTSDLKQIGEDVQSLQLQRVDSRRANRRIRKASSEMATLRQKIVSEAGELGQKVYGEQQKAAGFRKMFARNQHRVDRDSTDLSGSSDAGSTGSRGSRGRVSYPHF